MKTRTLLLIALLTFSLGFSQKKWTLKECVTHALENNISIKQNKLNIATAKENVKIAKGNFLPTVGGFANGNVNFGSSINPVTNSRVSVNTFTGSLGVSSNVTIFNGFSNINTKKQAILQNEGSKIDLKQIENDISLNVVNAYLNVLFAKENLSVALVQAEISKKQIDRVKAQFDAGAVPKGDVLNIESTAASDLQSLVLQENALNLAILQLTQLLQISLSNFDVALIETAEPSFTLLYDNATTVYEKAMTNRPEIERAKLNIESSDLSISIAKSAYLPSITGSLNIGSTYGYDLNSSTNTNFTTQLDETFGYGVGFSISVPIFNGFRTNGNVTKSKINKEISEIALESEKLRLQQTIEQAFLDAKAAAKTYEVSQVSLNAQKEAFKNAQISYDYGSITQFDFDQVRTRLVNAEASLISAKYDYIFKTKVLKFYYGETIID